MSRKYQQGEFFPKNPKKYIGEYPIHYRSSWEFRMMQVFDAHPNILGWASELSRPGSKLGKDFKIYYFNPFKNKMSLYVPDFFVVYIDKNNTKHLEIIEIKPSSETFMEKAVSKRDKLSLEVNKWKWKAASDWCKKRNIRFRVLTEEQIFGKKYK